MNATVAMQTKTIILFSSLFLCPSLYSMKNNENAPILIPTFPNEISHKILYHQTSKKPWKNFNHSFTLTRVCKAWENIIGTKEEIAKYLKIPLMHRTAITNDDQYIPLLKSFGRSIHEPDSHGFCAADYALACDKEKSFKMLALGFSGTNFDSEIDKHTFKENSSIKKLLSAKEEIITNCTLENLKQALHDNDYDKVVNLLFYQGFCAIELLLDEDENATIPENFQYLIKYCVDNFVETYLFTYIAKQIDYAELYFVLLGQGYGNPNTCNKNGNYLLHTLCIPATKDFFSVLEVLLALESTNVNITNKSKSTPLHTALETGYLEAAVALLETKKCDINALDDDNYPPIFFGVQNGHHECVNALIKHNADVAILLPKGANLLHTAAVFGHKQILATLIPLLKQKINHKDDLGRTALISCIIANEKYAADYIKLLIKAGADMQATTNNGQVALHYAAGFNRPEAAQILLKKGARVDTLIDQNEPIQGILYKNYTSLLLAAHRGYCEVVKILLEYGANKQAKTVLGETALDLAKKYRNIELTKNDIPSIERHKEKLAQYEEIIKILS